jgi:putative tryptophan/tyrosine transport system substrate-binding protein
MSLFYAQLGVKRLALLRELLVSKADVVAFLVNTSTIEGSSQLPDVLAAAHAAGQQVIVIHASTEPEIDAAFATLIERRAGLFSSAPSRFLRAGAPRSSPWQRTMLSPQTVPPTLLVAADEVIE